MVSKSFLLRLVLDGLATGLMVIALAYYWQGNTVHEWAGTAMFILVAAHNIFNRRWWGQIARPVAASRRPRTLFDRTWTLLLMVGMSTLLLTSLLISQKVFVFLQWGGGFTARQIHMAAAYWVVALVAVHLGMRWSRVMAAVRSSLPLAETNAAGTLVLRLLTLLGAGFGLVSSFDLGLGGKLAMQMSLDGWDFDTQAAGFFLRWGSILVLYAAIAHYALACMQHLERRAALPHSPKP